MRMHVSQAAVATEDNGDGMPAADAIPMPDLVAANAASGGREPPTITPAANPPGATSQDVDFSRRLARLQNWPAALRERDFSNLPAPALVVQVSEMCSVRQLLAAQQPHYHHRQPNAL